MRKLGTQGFKLIRQPQRAEYARWELKKTLSNLWMADYMAMICIRMT